MATLIYLVGYTILLSSSELVLSRPKHLSSHGNLFRQESLEPPFGPELRLRTRDRTSIGGWVLYDPSGILIDCLRWRGCVKRSNIRPMTSAETRTQAWKKRMFFIANQFNEKIEGHFFFFTVVFEVLSFYLNIQRLHSVKITEKFTLTFLTNISWKQRFTLEVRYLKVDFTKNGKCIKKWISHFSTLWIG